MRNRSVAGVSFVLGLALAMVPMSGVATGQAFTQPPTIQVEVRWDTIYGEYWPGTEVSLGVIHPDGTVEVLAPAQVLDDEGTISQGLGSDVQPGDIVRAEGEGTVKELVISPIEVTSVDSIADTVSGICTSAVRQTVTVWAWPPNIFVQTPCEDDSFFFDASAYYDIDPMDPDMSGWVGQEDPDGDNAVWSWDPPRGFGFEGFFGPIDNGALNVAKAGQVVPLRWQLLDASGVPVGDPTSFVDVTSEEVACESGVPVDAIETYMEAAATLHYLGDGSWGLSWKTQKSWHGCRTLTLALSDGSEHQAEFRFR